MSRSPIPTIPGGTPVGDAATLQLLVEASRDLNASLHLDEVMARVADRVKSLIDCDLFTLLLWCDEQQGLVNSFSRRFDERIDLRHEGVLALGSGITGTAAARRQPVRVGDVSKHPSYVYFRYADVELHSGLAVPLIVQDRLVGVLDLESSRYDAFSEEHEQILSALAAIIASALENAQLYEKVRAGERRLASDLDLAREVQKALLPERAPAIVGLDVGFRWLPAQQLGGDVFDFMRFDDRRLAVAVGDVAGKSTPAALYGSLAVGLLRGHAMEHAGSPAAMAGHLNAELCTSALDDRFLAMALVEYDACHGTLNLTNAGLPQLLLVRDGRVQRPARTDLALGIEAGVVYSERTHKLAPGDVLLACTDGLQESRNERGEEWGVARLEATLLELVGRPAQQIADGLLGASLGWTGANEIASDDRTIVVLKAT